MQLFPTQYSLLSAPAIASFIEKQYGYKGLDGRLLIHNVADTYILNGGGEKYIFKIYRGAHRTYEEIKAEVELINTLHAGGAKVASAISDLAGEFVQCFNAAEGTRHGVLFTYASGTVQPDLSDKQLETVGREMALIHTISASLELSYPRMEYNLDTMILEPLKRIREDFRGMEEEYRYLTESSDRVMKSISLFDLDQFSHGYCHYDYLPKNFHFTEDGRITFFDFDFAGTGYFVNDLSSFYAHFFLQVMFNKMTQAEADQAFAIFIAAYRSVRPLSDEELRAIPYFGFAWWIFYFGFHHDNFEDWSNGFYNPRFIKERVGWIKKWVEWYLFKTPGPA